MAKLSPVSWTDLVKRFRAFGFEGPYQDRHRFKKDEPNTVEHLNSGLPKVEEIVEFFPGAIIAGKQNGKTWLRYMRWDYMPYVRLTAGLLYKLFLIGGDNLPPYHACLLVWRKEKTSCIA